VEKTFVKCCLNGCGDDKAMHIPTILRMGMAKNRTALLKEEPHQYFMRALQAELHQTE